MRLSAPIFRLKQQAKQQSREQGLPLHQALDQCAKREGFRSWAHLTHHEAKMSQAMKLYSQISAGDMVLLAARPHQGKTMLGLELAARAAQTGQQSYFFSLEYCQANITARLHDLGIDRQNIGAGLSIDTSDTICADYIIQRLVQTKASKGALVVVDYLQLLDQRRQNPELMLQMDQLQAFVQKTGSILVLISQISRFFDADTKRLPTLCDLRLPNPIDLSVFTKTCFMHAGRFGIKSMTPIASDKSGRG